MNFTFGKTIATAAAAGLMGIACGGSSPEAEVPAAEAPSEEAMPAAEEAAPMGEETAAAEEKACCKGMNECAGKGGCKGDAHECAGKNECKGKGGCNAHCPK